MEAQQWYPLAHTIAREVGSPDDHDDLVQVGIMELHIALQRNQAKGEPIRNPGAYAGQVLWCAMKAYYSTGAERHAEKFMSQDELENPDVLFFRLHNRPEAYEQTFIQCYLSAVQRLLGPEAHCMAEALLHPPLQASVDATQAAVIKAMQQEQGNPVRGANVVRITHSQLREALGMEEAQWYQTLQRLRTFTRKYLSDA